MPNDISTINAILDNTIKKHDTILEKQIRAEVKRRRLTIYRVAKDSGVSQPVVSRFMNKKRGITLSTASKLVKTLGLELVVKKKTKR